MSDYLPVNLPQNYLVPLLLTVALLLLWLLYRHRRQRQRTLQGVIKSIAFDSLSDLVIPKADEGEIHIDHLLLTAEGLLIIDVKDVTGIVFGSDKMQDWTVIAADRRYTFANPQPALYDRIAAVRQIVRQVPVTGRVLFLDGAEFTKGTPGLVAHLDELLEEFSEQDKASAAVKIDAFKPHWELIQQKATMAHPAGGRRRAPVIRS
ncbi:MAG TPA: nuclease-related domain-containing protein [Woeseiaceae bacterium]|nr:nuclease-related domain-containing protein [Woeseiaceae bacterium]